MAAPTIPMRPKGRKFDLKPEEMDCLSWIVLSGCPKDEAFLRFIRPDYIMSRNTPAVKSAVKQFFAMAPVREYLEAYRETISSRNEESAPTRTPETIDEKKTMALTKLVEYVLSEASNIQDAADPKTILDYANKIGLFDETEAAVEQPRRYLPVTCKECEYRKFVEENCYGTDFDEETETNNNE